MTKLLSLFLLIALASCEAASNYSQPSYQETKMTLEEQEKLNPMDFLSTEATYRKNLLGEWVIEGRVTSKASVASYKDVTLNIIYYSGTDTEIGAERKTIYEFFKPNSSQSFKFKSFGVEGAKKIGVSIVSAASAN